MPEYHIECADVVEWAEGYEGEPFHAVLCDPPYELSFMNRKWDSTGVSFQPDTWAAIAEHLHPGAFLMAFGGSRTYHRLAIAMEDAGLILHPTVGWLQSQGFPKATRIDTQIDKAAIVVCPECNGTCKTRNPDAKDLAEAHFWEDYWIDTPCPNCNGTGRVRGAEREVIRECTYQITEGGYSGGLNTSKPRSESCAITAPATPLAKAWEGHRYGLQALKPCLELVCVAQKPYIGRPVECITETGAGALNIDQARIQHTEQCRPMKAQPGGNKVYAQAGRYTDTTELKPSGRWPPNFALVHHPQCKKVGMKKVKNKGGVPQTLDRKWGITGFSGDRLPDGYDHPHYFDDDGTETIEAWECHPSCPVRRLGEQSGERKGTVSGGQATAKKCGPVYGEYALRSTISHNDTGTAARFYPNCSWAYEIEEQIQNADAIRYQPKVSRSERDAGLTERCSHPTVKPIALTKWLATLLLPPPLYSPRRILVPFCGVASEMAGCLLVGWDYILGIELSPEYIPIAEARLHFWASYSLSMPDATPKDILKAAKKAARSTKQAKLL